MGHPVLELTQTHLKGVKQEAGTIDACALLKVATQIGNKCEVNNLLVTKLREHPEIGKCMSDRYFGRKRVSQALTAKGAYHLLLALDSKSAHDSCYAIGAYMGLDETTAHALLKQITADSDQTIQERCYSDDQKNEHTRHLQKLEKCSVSLQALLIATQLQQQIKGKVGNTLLERVQENIESLEEMTCAIGTHCAVGLLRMKGYTETESVRMAPSFNSFLKAARGNYIPNKRKPRAWANIKDVTASLYNPTLHAGIIQSAYESFKCSEAFAKHLDPSAVEQRQLDMRVMKVHDVAQAHSNPRADCATLQF